MKKILLFTIGSIFFFACKQSPKQQVVEIQFETMGTFGMVKIVSDSLIDEVRVAKDMDSILIDINMGLSTYIDSSVISLYNSKSIDLIDTNSISYKHFEIVGKSSYNIWFETEGTFNPFIKSLIDYYHIQSSYILDEIDSVKIDSILNCIKHSSNINFKTGEIYSGNCSQVDASAIAKGYGVDILAEYLKNLGYINYMVDIGGEVVTKGKNPDQSYWRLGIEEPNEEARIIYEVVELNNQAMATSGNYRNFKVLENGQKIVHIINPKTGYPEISNLLSASIVAPSCMEADAYATACMVMGLDTCFEFVLNQPELDCYLIYSDENGNLQNKYTEGFEIMLVE